MNNHQHRMPLVILLLGMLASLISFVVTPSAETVHADGPSAIDANAKGKPGIYVFYDWENLDPAVYPVVGGHVLFTWNRIETASGAYDWSWPDKWIGDVAKQARRWAWALIPMTENAAAGAACRLT